MTVSRVAGDVYMLGNGDGGNMAVFAGANAVVLVDTRVADTDATVAAVRKLSDKPVRYVINTHCHGDHTESNAVFQRGGAAVVAHANVRRRLEQGACDETGLGLPTITLDAEVTLHVEDEELRVIALPTGHTDGDVIAYFKKANVVHTGDVFRSSYVPFHSKYAGGKVLGLADALRKIVASVPEDAKVIPGHGQLASVSEIERAIAILDGVRDAVSRQVAAGKKLDELRTMNLLGPWREAIGDAAEVDWFLSKFYEALANADPPRRAAP